MRIVPLLLIALLAGCGQKGPLVLPDQHPGTVVTRPTQTPPPAPADDEQKKKDESTSKP